MSLLRDRINRDTREKERVEQKIQNVTVRPTESERTIADQLIRDVSEQFKEEISKCGLTEEIQEKIRLYVRSTITKLDYDDYSVKIRIEKVVLSSIIGLGPIDPFLHDPSVTEIIVQRYNCISVERNGLVEETDAEFVSEEHLMTVINRIIQPVGRQINLHSPLVDARLKDGSRVNATIPPISPDGATLTIRRFSEKAYTGEDYLSFGSLDEKMLYFLMRTVQGKASMIVSGGTGSGKTTLVGLIPRFYDASSGTIRVDGRNVNSYSLEELREKVHVVLQRAVLFRGTLRENLLWGNKNANDEEMQAAVKAAQAADFVQSKGGLDMKITAEGRNLSGGQRQRLSIARALVGNPEILILDDSASALDYVTEKALRGALSALPNKPTVFIVSQRTSSLRHADKILVLDDGALVGCGTHDALLASCSVYREIYDSQFGGKEAAAK